MAMIIRHKKVDNIDTLHGRGMLPAIEAENLVVFARYGEVCSPSKRTDPDYMPPIIGCDFARADGSFVSRRRKMSRTYQPISARLNSTPYHSDLRGEQRFVRVLGHGNEAGDVLTLHMHEKLATLEDGTRRWVEVFSLDDGDRQIAIFFHDNSLWCHEDNANVIRAYCGMFARSVAA